MIEKIRNKKTYKSLISENRLDESIKGLRFQIEQFLENNEDHSDFWSIKELEQAIISISGGLSEFEHEKLSGILDRETQNNTNAQIQSEILQIIDRLPKTFWSIKKPQRTISKIEKEIEAQKELEKTKALQEQRLKKTNIDVFIAYARKDVHFLDQLRIYLKPLHRNKTIKIWYDGEIVPGTVWEKHIKTNLHNADIILMLVSAYSLASDYFYDKELAEAMRRHHQEETIVIPVILSDCIWEQTDLKHLQALPRDGKPIKSWDDESSAYSNIVRGLYKSLEEVLKRRDNHTKAIELLKASKKEEEQRLKKEKEAKEKAEQEKKHKEEADKKKKRAEEQRLKQEREAKGRAAQTKNKEQKLANEKLVEKNQFASDKHNISESQSLLTIAENLFEKGMYRSALSKFEEAKVFDQNNANIDARITITRDKLNKSQKSTPNEMAKIGVGLLIAVIIFIILYGISVALMQGW